MALTEIQNSRVGRPGRLSDWNCGVEPGDKQLQQPPEQIIAVPGRVAYAGELGADLVIADGDEAWEHLKHGDAAFAICVRT